MIVDIDNIAGNEKATAGKENIKVKYTSFILDCYVSVMNFKMSYTSI